MQRDRAWRRAQRERKIKNIQQWMKDRRFYTGREITVEESNQQYWDWAKHRHAAPAGCSGFCCGNPRKWFKASTIQEVRFADQCRKAFDEEGIRVHVARPHKEG